MDGQMSKGLLRSKGLSHYGSIIKSVRARRGTVSVLSGVSTCREFNANQGGRKGAETYVLH